MIWSSLGELERITSEAREELVQREAEAAQLSAKAESALLEAYAVPGPSNESIRLTRIYRLILEEARDMEGSAATAREQIRLFETALPAWRSREHWKRQRCL